MQTTSTCHACAPGCVQQRLLAERQARAAHLHCPRGQPTVATPQAVVQHLDMGTNHNEGEGFQVLVTNNLDLQGCLAVTGVHTRAVCAFEPSISWLFH